MLGRCHLQSPDPLAELSAVHLISLLPALSTFRVIQSMLNINRNGERMQPCFTPVFISNVSVGQ